MCVSVSVCVCVCVCVCVREREKPKVLGDFGGVFLLEAKHTCVRLCVTEKGVGLCCRQQEELHKDEEPAGHSD